jgi:hypothetical protein
MSLQRLFLLRLVQDPLVAAERLDLVDAVVSSALDCLIDLDIFLVKLIGE